jgi:hypothetical protein
LFSNSINTYKSQTKLGTSIVATGGTVTTGTDAIGDYKIHTFEANGTFTLTETRPDAKFEVLIVGAGGTDSAKVEVQGSMADRANRRGLSGECFYTSELELKLGEYPVVVGQVRQPVPADMQNDISPDYVTTPETWEVNYYINPAPFNYLNQYYPAGITLMLPSGYPGAPSGSTRTMYCEGRFWEWGGHGENILVMPNKMSGNIIGRAGENSSFANINVYGGMGGISYLENKDFASWKGPWITQTVGTYPQYIIDVNLLSWKGAYRFKPSNTERLYEPGETRTFSLNYRDLYYEWDLHELECDIDGQNKFYGKETNKGATAQPGVVIIKYYVNDTSSKVFFDGGKITATEQYTCHTFKKGTWGLKLKNKLPFDKHIDVLFSQKTPETSFEGNKRNYYWPGQNAYGINIITKPKSQALKTLKSLPIDFSSNYEINVNDRYIYLGNKIYSEQVSDKIVDYYQYISMSESYIDPQYIQVKTEPIIPLGFPYATNGPAPGNGEDYYYETSENNFTIDLNLSLKPNLNVSIWLFDDYWDDGFYWESESWQSFYASPGNPLEDSYLKITTGGDYQVGEEVNIFTHMVTRTNTSLGGTATVNHWDSNTKILSLKDFKGMILDNAIIEGKTSGANYHVNTVKDYKNDSYTSSDFTGITKDYYDRNDTITIRYRSDVSGIEKPVPEVKETLVSGSVLFDEPGIHYWVCPENVYSVSVVCIGGGGAGGINYPNAGANGGGGGALAWKNNISVTPGKKYIVKVGYGGKPNFGDYFEYEILPGQTIKTLKRPYDMPIEWLMQHEPWGNDIWPAATGQGGRKSFFLDDWLVCAGGGAGGAGGIRTYSLNNPNLTDNIRSSTDGYPGTNAYRIKSVRGGHDEVMYLNYVKSEQSSIHNTYQRMTRYGSVAKRLFLPTSKGGQWIGDGGENGSDGGASIRPDTPVRIVGQGGNYRIASYQNGINPLDWYNYSGGGGGAGGYGRIGKAGGGSVGSDYTKTNVYISPTVRYSPSFTTIDPKSTPGYGGAGTSPYGSGANGVNGLINSAGTTGSPNTSITMESLDGGNASIKQAWPSEIYFLEGNQSWWPGKGGKYGGGSGGNGLGGYDRYRIIISLTGWDMTITESNMGQGDAGGDGCVRIIWGPNRSFPSSNTASP